MSWLLLEKRKVNSTVKQIAKQRIQILFQQAERTCRDNPQLSQRYVQIARKIAMSARMRLPTESKRRICKKCNSFLVPGQNSRVRIKPRRELHKVVTCLNCGNQTRIPLKPKLKEKKEIEQNNNKNEASC
jgi:ribonuclease P protein subunit RPR2